MGDAANNSGGSAGIRLGAGTAGMIGQALQQLAPPAPAPAAPVASATGDALNHDQIQATIDGLDMRFSQGEISEELCNRLTAKWEAKQKELGG